jgi:hypothetical protein
MVVRASTGNESNHLGVTPGRSVRAVPLRDTISRSCDYPGTAVPGLLIMPLRGYFGAAPGVNDAPKSTSH